MKVEAEVKIKILDGEEQGKIDTFTAVGETDTTYTEHGIVESLRLEWKHIHNVCMVGSQESDDNQYNREKCYECYSKDKSVLDMPCCKCSAENDYIYFNARDWEYESTAESEEKI